MFQKGFSTVLIVVTIAAVALIIGFWYYESYQSSTLITSNALPPSGTVITRSNAIDITFGPDVSSTTVAALAKEYGARIDFLDFSSSTPTSVDETVFEFTPSPSLDINGVTEKIRQSSIVENATTATYIVEYDQPL